MTKDALIEALAEAQWRWHHPVMQWSEAPEPIKCAYRVQVEHEASVVVEFVAEWLGNRVYFEDDEPLFDEDGNYVAMADEWRKQMDS